MLGYITLLIIFTDGKSHKKPTFKSISCICNFKHTNFVWK